MEKHNSQQAELKAKSSSLNSNKKQITKPEVKSENLIENRTPLFLLLNAKLLDSNEFGGDDLKTKERTDMYPSVFSAKKITM